jgi:uncharacterized protein
LLKHGLELFALPCADSDLILYAHLLQKMAKVNESAIDVVSRYLDGETMSTEEAGVIQILASYGFFEEAAPMPVEDSFEPVQVTLFPSDGCNLRCRYCYATATVVKNRMSFATGRAAIDLVAANALKKQALDFVVNFHGNGEPFTAFKLIQELCAYALTKSEEIDVKLNLSIATNGVLTEEQQDFLLAWFSGVNVSFDGLPDLQNRQRPKADGSASFPQVEATLKRLDAMDKNYGIRATLTAESVERLEEIVDFVQSNFKNCRHLHLEPAWECGRCLTTGEQSPDVDLFVEKYLRAAEKLRSGGMRLVFSGERHNLLTNSFCAVSTGGFTVTTDGNVTACYEVCNLSDQRSNKYFYGHYQPDQNVFRFDEEKLKILRGLKVENMPYCQDCFCKWHCAGDCAAKVLGTNSPDMHRGSERCRITRALTLEQVRKVMREGRHQDG